MNENFRKWEEEHKNSTGEHRGRGRERQIGMVQMCRASSVIQCKGTKRIDRETWRRTGGKDYEVRIGDWNS